MNSKFVTLFVIIAALLLVSLLTLNGDMVWLALPFLAYLVFGILRAPTAETVRLEADRSVEQAERLDAGDKVGEHQILVTIRVRNLGKDIDQLLLVDGPQIGVRYPQGRPQQRLALRAGEETTFTYCFQTGRGQFYWESIHAVASDPLGLTTTTLDVPAGGAIQVLPELVRFRSLPLRPQRTLHLAGAIPARLSGSGTDFWGIREYQPGDRLQRLDWHHTARHPGRRYTREFEQEEIAEIGLILDARQSMDLRVGNDSLFEHSTGAAASLAEVFLRQGNRVSLLVYGDPVINVYPGYGKVQLHRILNTLTQVRTELGGSLGSLQFLPVRMFSSRSIILIISPLNAGDWRLFPRLRAFGYQVVVVSPDPVDFVQHMLPKDIPSRLSIRLSQIERQLEIKRISRLWIPVINWQVHQPLQPLVQSALNDSYRQHTHVR